MDLNKLISKEINRYARLVIEEAGQKPVIDNIQYAIPANIEDPSQKDGTPIMDDEYYY